MGWRNPLTRLLRTITAAGLPGVDIGSPPPGWSGYWTMLGETNRDGASAVTIYDGMPSFAGDYVALDVSAHKFNVNYWRTNTMKTPVILAFDGGVDQRTALTVQEQSSGSYSAETLTPTGVSHTYYHGPSTKYAQLDVDASGSRLQLDVLNLSPPPYPTATLLNGWDNYDVVNWMWASYVLSAGVVTLRGLVKHANAAQTGAIFVLPAGYRPRIKRVFTVWAYNGSARVDVWPDGSVLLSQYGPSAAAYYVSLDGISFHPSPS